MASSCSSSTTVSAPGKVLLAGGYLVLEYPNSGLVLAADKRFYSTVKTRTTTANDDDNKNNDDDISMTIVVHSPQFHSKWTYTVTTTQDSFELAPSPSSDDQEENPFVEKTLRLTLAYLWTKKRLSRLATSPALLEICIRADNDFYSVIPHLEEMGQRPTYHNVSSLPRFMPCPLVLVGVDDTRNGQDTTRTEPLICKTGLGSSASLVTSLVASLLQASSAKDDSSNITTNADASSTTNADTTATATSSTNSSSSNNMVINIRQAHNLAQLSHCHAQGKVGSGFDVSAAVHGSHVYCRFPKDTPSLTKVMEALTATTSQPASSSTSNASAESSSSTSLSRETAVMLTQLVDCKWRGGVVAPLTLPGSGLQLLLADVCGGSESPSMARKVLQCKNEGPYWENLAVINDEIIALWKEVQDLNVDQLCTQTYRDWDDDFILQRLRKAFLRARANLKALGEAAQVPIEPDAQTALANATMELPGVVAAVVPGAGGYDALACLHVDSNQVRDSIAELWANWKGGDGKVCTLAVQAGSYGDGLRNEVDFDCS